MWGEVLEPDPRGWEGKCCSLTTTSTVPNRAIANSNIATCSSHLVTSHLMNAASLQRRVTGEMTCLSIKTLPSHGLIRFLVPIERETWESDVTYPPSFLMASATVFPLTAFTSPITTLDLKENPTTRSIGGSADSSRKAHLPVFRKDFRCFFPDTTGAA